MISSSLFTINRSSFSIYSLSATIHRLPFLRLVIPLVAGIICGDDLFYQGQSEWAAFCFYSLFLFSFVLLLFSFFLRRYSTRSIFGIVLFFFLFMTGGLRVNGFLEQNKLNFPVGEAVYRAVILEKPEMKERTMLCHVGLEPVDSVIHDNSHFCKVLLYLAKDSLSTHLYTGDELLVYARVSPPVNNGNPDEFDYARFLLRRQVSGVGFVSAGNWKLYARHELQSLRQCALRCRENVLALYRKLGFEGDDFAVLSALTVGYKEELSEEIRETYSVSGASHVLALSGLHIGFLYALLWLILRCLPRSCRITMWLRTLLLILFLWGFAFLTGLSASVVRSVMMFSLFALAGLSGRQSFSLNTLLVSAFLMLLYHPVWLFDIGFQLSFCAVAAILLLQSWLFGLLPVSCRVGKYIWGLMTVSVAAQIGVAPLVLFYFSRFSTHFLLTNLLVIPLVSVILYLAVVMLALMPFPMLQSGIAIGVKTLIGILNASVRWVEQLPWSSVDGIWVYPFEVLGFYLLLLLSLGYLHRRRGKDLVACLICFFLVGFCHLAMQIKDRPCQEIVFYNVRNCPVVHCVATDGRSWLAYADSLPDEKRLYKILSAHWKRLHLQIPCSVTADYKDSCFSSHQGILSFSGYRICLVNDERWRNKTTSQPLYIDYLYLCKGYGGYLQELKKIFTPRQVVLDSSLSEARKRAYEAECRYLGIQYISLSDKGSVSFLL